MKRACQIARQALNFEKSFLFLDDRARRAGVDTGAAGEALIGVDLVVLIALGDSAGRAAVRAGAAGNAIAFNCVHFLYSSLVYCSSLLRRALFTGRKKTAAIEMKLL